jgi:hypothetical protein
MSDVWLKCSACKSDIAFRAVHWVCSVSTCNRSRTRLVFCSVACWDSHVAILRHRDAWAVEAKAPTRTEWEAQQAEEPDEPPAPTPTVAPRRVITPVPAPAPPPSSNPALSSNVDRDVLIVVSKMKKYIKDRSGMNCSDAVAEQLSDHVRAICDDAIRAAAADNRKTVLDRDVPRTRR